MHQNLAFKHLKNEVRSQHRVTCPELVTDGEGGAPCQIVLPEMRIYMRSELQCSGWDVSEVLAKTIWGLLLVFRTTGKNLIFFYLPRIPG